jgi:putative heme iron utilization protein
MAGATKEQNVNDALTLMRSVASGVLSTQSLALPGYPFGSVAPFVLQADGSAVVLISAIAQHTANIRANPKVSLMVRQEESPEGGAVADAQAVGRVTLVGDAREVPEERLSDVAERYFLFFPDSRGHRDVHDFSFYAVEPVRIRYIGGFGSIHWIEPDAWAAPQASWDMTPSAIIDHMNEDHGDALAAMCHAFRADASGAAEMLTVDPAGFHVRTPATLHYFVFAEDCGTSGSVRGEMVRLTRAAREHLSG